MNIRSFNLFSQDLVESIWYAFCKLVYFLFTKENAIIKINRFYE